MHQALALVQGLFLLFLLYQKRAFYQKTPLLLLTFCILSIISYILRDDDNNLFVEGADWFLFDTSLFITFLLLFSIYLNVGNEHFKKKYYLLLIPNLVYFGIEALETVVEEIATIEIFDFFVELLFTLYLGLIVTLAFKNKVQKWLVNFIVPIFLLFLIARINEMTDIFDYTFPLGIFGKIADSLFLKNYMTNLLTHRNKIIKDFSESDKWQQVL